VPTGAVAFSRGAGPVRDTLSAVGEYRSHTMMSHAPGGWVTHASMKQPGQNGWPYACRVPLDQNTLQNGYPGASQVTQGAIYTYIYSNGTNEALYYQQGNGDGQNRGTTVANWLWSTMPYTAVNTSSGTIYRLGTAQGLTNYSLYQFRTLQGRNSDGQPWNNGIVCSTLLAYAQNQSGNGMVNDFGYNPTQVTNGLNALRNSVHDQCSATDGFWSWLGSVAQAVACVGADVCGHAGDEVTNCMANGQCGATSSDWLGFDHVDPNWQQVANGSTSTDSISPDAIGGWNGHPWGSTAPNPVWSYDGNEMPQWNSGGNVYSCWSN
jgi:hypothetical protein